MTDGEEVTFDYFAGARDNDSAGAGKHRYDMHLLTMEGRLLGEVERGDKHKRYAIDLSRKTVSKEEDKTVSDEDDDFAFAQKC
jgi:hypothetical protein